MYRKLLFDLDGTLTDPKEGICKSVQYALHAFGIEEPDIEVLKPFIGPPLAESFMEFYGMTKERAAAAVEKYRERFSRVGLFENVVYDGIPEMLQRLQGAGYELAVASSKPTVFVEQILEHFDLRRYFAVVVGSELGGARVGKDEVIEETLRQLFGGEKINCAEVLMIGDRKFDVEGAKAHGMNCVGVTYGYAFPGELEQAGAAYLADSPAELERLLISLRGLMRDDRGMARLPEKDKAGRQGHAGEARVSGQNAPIWMLADVFLPLLVYFLASGAALYLLNAAVLYAAESLSGDGGAWAAAHASAIQVADNAIAMLLGAFCVRRQLLAETVGDGGPIVAKPRKIAAGWIKAGAERLRKDWKWYPALSGAGAGVALACNCLVSILQMTAHDKAYQQVAGVQYAVPVWLGLIAYGVVSPVAEEAVFRGILYNRCKRYLGRPVVAAVLSSLLFGVLHGNVTQGIYGFVIGLVITWFYEEYRSFLAPVLVHAAANVSVFAASYYGLIVRTETAAACGAISALVAAALIVLAARRRKRDGRK